MYFWRAMKAHEEGYLPDLAGQTHRELKIGILNPTQDSLQQAALEQSQGLDDYKDQQV